MERTEVGSTQRRAERPAPPFALRQEATWSDGRDLVQGLERGRWSYHHVLYFPVAQGLFALVGGALGAAGTLLLLSAAATGLAAALFLCAARELVGRGVALGATALLVTAPGVVFYATTVEVHALQLALACGAVLWAVRQRTDASVTAWPAALLLCGLVGTHLTGLAWAPACAWMLFRTRGGWARPRGLGAAAVVLVAFLGLWLSLRGDTALAGGHVLLGLESAFGHWRPELLVREVLAPAGLLYGCALLGMLAFPASVRAARPRLRTAVLLLLVPMVPFASTVEIYERGAYFLSLAPVVALLAVQWMRFVRPGVALAVALVLALVQGAWAWREVDEWEHRYPGHEWIEALLEETGERGIVLTSHAMEVSCIQGHSELGVLYVRTRGGALDLQQLFPRAERVLGLVKRRGEPIVVTRSLFEIEDPDVQAFVETLTARYGEPRAGARPEYSFLSE
jgi:hypothetical protein